jgi:long-chain acyl-CoA synthetase
MSYFEPHLVKERVTGHGVWCIDELPKGPSGKVLKRDIAIPLEA